MIRKSIHTLGYLLFLITVIILLLEISFRYQWIDFYRAELKALNPSIDEKKNNILVFGDSFTARPNSYLSDLKKALPTFNIINCALPGSGIKQHELFFRDRIDQFKPVHIIYQFYLGNDLLDIEHPINWETLPFWRNTYWWASEQLLILQYLNFKLAFLNIPGHNPENLREKPFSPLLYNKRTQVYLKGNPNYLDHTIHLKNEQESIYNTWKKKFEELVKIDTIIPFSLIVIPHNCQVSKDYRDRMLSLGAQFQENSHIVNYPLIQRLRSDFPEVKLINPLGAFQQAEQQEIQLFFENDPHLTENGQRALAKVVLEELSLDGSRTE